MFGPILHSMNKVRPVQTRTEPADATERAELWPHVAVAPGLLEQRPVVVREEDDTDADYEARTRLLAAALAVLAAAPPIVEKLGTRWP
jgi:hypothetical protein